MWWLLFIKLFSNGAVSVFQIWPAVQLANFYFIPLNYRYKLPFLPKFLYFWHCLHAYAPTVKSIIGNVVVLDFFLLFPSPDFLWSSVLPLSGTVIFPGKPINYNLAWEDMRTMLNPIRTPADSLYSLFFMQCKQMNNPGCIPYANHKDTQSTRVCNCTNTCLSKSPKCSLKRRIEQNKPLLCILCY